MTNVSDDLSFCLVSRAWILTPAYLQLSRGGYRRCNAPPDDDKNAAVLSSCIIAEALSIPIGTVKSRIARGRRMLLEPLGNRDPGDERPTRKESTGTDGVPPPPGDQPAPPSDP